MGNGSVKSGNQYSEEVVKGLIETSRLQAENEARSLALQEKQIEAAKENANKMIEAQKELLLKAPDDHRKIRSLYLRYAVFFVLIIFSFLSLGLYFGKDDFLKFIIDKGIYAGVSVASFYVGRMTKSSKEKSDDSIPDANVVE